MEGEEKKGPSRMEKWRATFRVVVIDPETLKEQNSFETNRLTIAGLLGAGAILAILIFAFILIVTPLKTFIPGYADFRQHPELFRLNQELQFLEDELGRQKLVNESFQRMFVGDDSVRVEESADVQEEFPDSMLYVKRSKEDEILRKEIEFDQKVKQNALLTSSSAGSGKSLDQMYLLPPISGVLSSGFDASKKHFGTDLTAPKNTPIHSVLDGVVFMADWTLDTGFTMGIRHDNDVLSFYKHNNALLKKAGDTVKAGEAIAIIGNTGSSSSGPHLHFELWYKGIPVNPERFILFK